MTQNSEYVMLLIYGVILGTFLIAWLIVRRVNKKIDAETAENMRNQVWAKCACGFEKIYDRRTFTLTKCPMCGVPAIQPI